MIQAITRTIKPNKRAKRAKQTKPKLPKLRQKDEWASWKWLGNTLSEAYEGVTTYLGNLCKR